MSLDQAVLQVELRQLPDATLPARITVHKDDTVTLNGDFGTAHARLTRFQSRELQSLAGLLDLKASFKQYGDPDETAAIIAEVSVAYRKPQKDLVLCWDHHPRDPEKRAEYQRTKLLVKRVAGMARELQWNSTPAQSYTSAIYNYLNSSGQPASP